jgi:hypothetical protein
MKTVLLIETESVARNGKFDVRLKGEENILCTSRTPLLTAARRLLERGYDPATILKTVKNGEECLTAELGTAAKLTVHDNASGKPVFATWQPFSEAEITETGRFRTRVGVSRATRTRISRNSGKSPRIAKPTRRARGRV